MLAAMPIEFRLALYKDDIAESLCSFLNGTDIPSADHNIVNIAAFKILGEQYMWTALDSSVAGILGRNARAGVGDRRVSSFVRGELYSRDLLTNLFAPLNSILRLA